MVCSLTLFFLATSATDVRSASRRIATICSSVSRLFLIGSSLTKSHLSRNHRSEETGQVKIVNLLKRLQDELGVAYLFITHNFGVVEYLAHDIAVMKDGRIVEAGPAQDILVNPESDYTRELLQSVPRLPVR